jgi:hypothetical protein
MFTSQVQLILLFHKEENIYQPAVVSAVFATSEELHSDKLITTSFRGKLLSIFVLESPRLRRLLHIARFAINIFIQKSYNTSYCQFITK